MQRTNPCMTRRKQSAQCRLVADDISDLARGASESDSVFVAVQARRAFLPPRILDTDAGTVFDAQLDNRNGRLEHVIIAGPRIFVGIDPFGDDQITLDNLPTALPNGVAVSILVLMQADNGLRNAHRFK